MKILPRTCQSRFGVGGCWGGGVGGVLFVGAGVGGGGGVVFGLGSSGGVTICGGGGGV